MREVVVHTLCNNRLPVPWRLNQLEHITHFAGTLNMCLKKLGAENLFYLFIYLLNIYIQLFKLPSAIARF